MAVGLAIARLLGTFESPWSPRTIGVTLLAAGGEELGNGFISYRKALVKLQEEGVRGTSTWLIGLVTLALILSCVLAVLLIFEEA